MSNLFLANPGLGVGDRHPKPDCGDGPRMHQRAVGITASVLTWLHPIATAAAKRARHFKTHERTERVAVAMRRCASAIESGRFVLRCSMAASLAYGLATLVGLQHPVWAPIEALIVSQESMRETLDSIHGRLVGTLIGVVVALSVGVLGRMIGLPLMLQIAISVTVCAMATLGRPAIRVCLWTCPLLLVTAPSLGAPELVGMIRVFQVLLGAIVGGMTHVLDQKLWDHWNSLSAREDARSAELPSKRQGVVARVGISRPGSRV